MTATRGQRFGHLNVITIDNLLQPEPVVGQLQA